MYLNRTTETLVAIMEGDLGGSEFTQGMVEGLAGKLDDAEISTLVHDGHQASLLTAPRGRALVLDLDRGASAVMVTWRSGEDASVARAILASVRVDASSVLDPLALMGVEFASVDGLELWGAIGAVVMFREPGVEPPMPATAATLALIHLPTPERLSDEELGSAMGATIATLRPDFDTMQESEARIDGLVGAELVMMGKKDDVPVAIFCMGVRDDHSAFILYGSVGVDRGPELLNRFRQLGRSLRRTAS
jgi:hypothetical protein